MKTSRILKSPVPDIIRSASETKFLTSLTPKNRVFNDRKNPDVELVAHLDQWKKNYDNIASIDNAARRLNRKISRLDIVEDVKMKRKLRLKLPDLKPEQLRSLIGNSKKRRATREAEENFKDRCRFHREYENELQNSLNSYTADIKKIKEKIKKIREKCLKVKQKLRDTVEECETIKNELAKNRENIRNDIEDILTAKMTNLEIKTRSMIKEEVKQTKEFLKQSSQKTYAE